MAEKARPARYKLKEVCIRLAQGHSLYSDLPLSSPMEAVKVMRGELSRYDREVLCVVNLDARLHPINFHVVSVGSLDQAVVSIPNIMKSGILSNASSFMMLHNHPSGDVTPSEDDIQTTRKVIEAGKLMGIACLDHIVVGGGNGNYYSMREEGTVDFSSEVISMTAEDILRVGETDQFIKNGGTETMAESVRKDDVRIPDFVQEGEAQMAKGELPEPREEISIKFGKGLAQPFTSKDGKEYTQIKIPNRDPADKTPWASFVLPTRAVHENKFGKGLWAKIPADGTTVVSKPALRGQDENGKNIWQDEKIKVLNCDLKTMVEAYKTRSSEITGDQISSSIKENLDALAKAASAKQEPEKKPKAKVKSKAKGPEL